MMFLGKETSPGSPCSNISLFLVSLEKNEQSDQSWSTAIDERMASALFEIAKFVLSLKTKFPTVNDSARHSARYT